MQNAKVMRKLLLGGTLLTVVLAFGGCGSYIPTYETNGIVMGTTFSAKVQCSSKELADQLLPLGTRLEQETLSYRLNSSELSGINVSAQSSEGYPLSEEMEEILKLCLEVSAKSEGAFDITIGPLVRLWNIDARAGESFETEEDVLPESEEIKAQLECCGYEKVKIEDHRIYLPKGCGLDLGAVGKGIYLDAARIQLGNASMAVLAAGGSVLTLGEKQDKSAFHIGVVDPQNPEKTYGILQVKGDAAISTSGGYERYILVDGKTYHHIIDPRSGYPANSDVLSVTVLMDPEANPRAGFLSDALSTAIFVLGSDDGMKLAEEYDAALLLILNDGSFVTNAAFENDEKYIFEKSIE